MTTTTISLTVMSEADARIENLGMRREFEQMLERVRQTVPDLHALEVTLEPDYEEGLHPGIVIWAVKPAPREGDFDPSDMNLGEWMVATFSPDVRWHFCIISSYEPSHEG